MGNTHSENEHTHTDTKQSHTSTGSDKTHCWEDEKLHGHMESLLKWLLCPSTMLESRSQGKDRRGRCPSRVHCLVGQTDRHARAHTHTHTHTHTHITRQKRGAIIVQWRETPARSESVHSQTQGELRKALRLTDTLTSHPTPFPRVRAAEACDPRTGTRSFMTSHYIPALLLCC